jgi:uracil-DNA glycosylase family 4
MTQSSDGIAKPDPTLSQAEQLAALYTQLESVATTLPLATRPHDIVPGEGAPSAEIMFIGEAPGYHESVERRPFVGRSGQLFRKVLEEVGIPQTEVYISNIVKVRPPDNRDPLPAEIAAYKPYLDQEITIIQPKVIVTLGRLSMAKFLPNVKVSQVHGRLHKVTWQGQPLFVLPMYHPAAALRAPQVKTSFIQDFKKLPKVLDWIAEHQETQQLVDEVKAVLY